MKDEIRVKVHSYGPGRPLGLVYFDPLTGKKICKSSGTYNEKEAERAAAVLQDELNSGRYAAPSKITWADFRKRYEDEKLSALAPASMVAATVSLDHLERVLNPDRLAKLTPAVMSKFQAKLRAEKMKETTIARHLRHIKAALRWAAVMGMMAKAPAIEMPKLPKGQTLMKGRPITAEEYDRMLAAVRKVRPHDTPAWKRFLNGLWLSGLRLEEACNLSWDEESPFAVDLSGRRPVFRIYAEAQKARRDELLPMTPDFAEWLLATYPAAERHGQVFKLPTVYNGKPFTHKQVGRIVSRIGKRAKVVTNKAEGKYAGAHDLRRAFGTRWAKRVMPAVLQRLMRHAEVSTTMKYYVATSAADVADELWEQYGAAESKRPARGNTLGNTLPSAIEKMEGR
jgi:integrase